MTPTGLPSPMRRSRALRLLTAPVILALLVATLASPTHAESHISQAPAAGQARVLITLFSDSSAHGDPPQLHYSIAVNTTVEGNQTHREIQVPLPHGARLHDFRLYDEGEVPGPTTRTRVGADGSWALAEWDQQGPVPGRELTMRLEARQDVDPDNEIPVEWDRLNVSLTTVWIALPPSHIPLVDPDKTVRREDPRGGLDLWNLTGTEAGRLSLIIGPLGTHEDLSLAFTPPAWSAFAVLLALALLSGGAWFLGKKSESRKLRRQREEHPPPR